MRKIINITTIDGDVYALFDDGNIGQFWNKGRGEWGWLPLDHPPVNLFETKEFIERNYSLVMYVCYIPENEEVPDHYKLFGHPEWKHFCISTWNEISNIMTSSFPDAIKLNTNPIEKYDDYKVVQTWVMK